MPGKLYQQTGEPISRKKFWVVIPLHREGAGLCVPLFCKFTEWHAFECNFMCMHVFKLEEETFVIHACICLYFCKTKSHY